MSDDLDFDMEVVKNENASSSSAADVEEEKNAESESSVSQDSDTSSADDRRSPGSEEPHKTDSGESLAGTLRQPDGSSVTEWEVVKLGDVLELEYGDNLPERDREDGSVPVYGSNGKVDTHSEPAVSAPGLVLGRKGSIGEIVLSESPFWPIDTTYYITSDETSLNLSYLQNLLQGLQLESLNAASAIPGLNRNDVYNLRVIVPSLPEQRKIASVLSAVDQAIQKTEAIIEQAKRVKRGLMQDLFHGRHKSHDEYKSTPVGEVPSHWGVESIGSVVEMAQYGISESMSESGEYPIFRMNNIENGYMIDEPMKYIDLDEDEFEKYRVEKRDILFNRTNSLELVGKTGIFELEDDYVFASYLVRLRANDRVDPYYLNYYMNSYEGQNRMMDFATKGVSQANINANSIQQVKLPVPPKNEQEQIVSQLRAIDQEIDHNKVYVSQLRLLKTGLMQDLLTGEVRTTGKAIDVLDEVVEHG